MDKVLLTSYFVGLGFNFFMTWFVVRKRERLSKSYMAAYFELWKRLDGFKNYQTANHVLDIYFDKSGNPRKTLKELNEVHVR